MAQVMLIWIVSLCLSEGLAYDSLQKQTSESNPSAHQVSVEKSNRSETPLLQNEGQFHPRLRNRQLKQTSSTAKHVSATITQYNYVHTYSERFTETDFSQTVYGASSAQRNNSVHPTLTSESIDRFHVNSIAANGSPTPFTVTPSLCHISHHPITVLMNTPWRPLTFTKTFFTCSRNQIQRNHAIASCCPQRLYQKCLLDELVLRFTTCKLSLLYQRDKDSRSRVNETLMCQTEMDAPEDLVLHVQFVEFSCSSVNVLSVYEGSELRAVWNGCESVMEPSPVSDLVSRSGRVRLVLTVKNDSLLTAMRMTVRAVVRHQRPALEMRMLSSDVGEVFRPALLSRTSSNVCGLYHCNCSPSNQFMEVILLGEFHQGILGGLLIFIFYFYLFSFGVIACTRDLKRTVLSVVDHAFFV